MLSKFGHVLTKRALIIDDDPIICMVIRMFLEHEERFIVKVLHTGDNAAKAALDWEPHIILLDLEMPDPDGIKTFHLLRAIPKLATTPICFVTGSVDPVIHSSLQQLGALSVFTKPLDLSVASKIYELAAS